MLEVETKYGVVDGIVHENYFTNGNIKECLIEKKNIIKTNIGELIPKFENFEARSKNKNALTFFESGILKSIYLDNQQVVSSPLGEMDAEMITFYEDGNVHRVFPLYGQVSGFWSEDEEISLAKEYTVDMEKYKFTCKISCFCFYPSGRIKSLTLCKGENIFIETPAGKLRTRYGISFYENGNIKSVEPLNPYKIDTLIGNCSAFDNAPLGVHGDNNSLHFNEDGSIKSFITATHSITIKTHDQEILMSPQFLPSLIDIDELELVPIKVEFDAENVNITNVYGEKFIFSLENNDFSCNILSIDMTKYCSGTCSSCSSCSSKCH